MTTVENLFLVYHPVFALNVKPLLKGEKNPKEAQLHLHTLNNTELIKLVKFEVDRKE